MASTKKIKCCPPFADANCQPCHTPETLKKQGQQARGKLAQFSFALAEHLGIIPELSLTIAPQKALTRAIQKAADKHNGDASQVKDYTRNRLPFSKNKQYETLRAMLTAGKVSNSFLETWRKKGFEIIEHDDAFAKRKKSGWVGMNLSVRVPLNKGNYHICELQIIPAGMLETDKNTHNRYEKYIRPVTDFAKDRKLTLGEYDKIKHHIDANREAFNLSIEETETADLLSTGERQIYNQEMAEYHERKAVNYRLKTTPRIPLVPPHQRTYKNF